VHIAMALPASQRGIPIVQSAGVSNKRRSVGRHVPNRVLFRRCARFWGQFAIQITRSCALFRHKRMFEAL